MTWGVQNSQEDAFEQLDLALEQGVNFIETAELYPVPLTAPEWKPGTTETILGAYLDKIGPAARDDLVIATKIAGYFPNSPVAAARRPGGSDNPLPDGRLDAASVREATAASLRRLQTNVIDLMQIHWPDRYVPLFGQMEFDASQARKDSIAIFETAQALKEMMGQGKIRYIGLSNETPFGMSEWIRACETLGIRDKLVTIQNSYSLLDRRFDYDLAEPCHYYGGNIGLLPWSVLAGGLLTGKYRNNNDNQDWRFVKYPEYMRRWSPTRAAPQTLQAVDDYAQVAQDFGMTLTQLSLEFARTRPFVRSTIVGATTVEQLQENLQPFSSSASSLDEDLMAAINQVHMKCRDPCCSL